MAVALAGLPVCTGCTAGYIVTVALGELGVLLGSKPIDEVLESSTLDEETRLKLEYVQAVRRYAVNDLKLVAGNAYATFYDSEGEAVVYNISACRKDRLEAYEWWFPFVNAIQYVGFFEEKQAECYADLLRKQGWDVFMYAPHGYSTMGWFADPLFSQALERDAIDLADLVIHELAHNTVYRNGDSVFTETVATFIGRTGTLKFLAHRYGEDHEVLRIAVERWEDLELYNRFWIDLYDALDAFYSRQDLSSEEKIARREDIFAEYRERFRTEYMPQAHIPDRFSGFFDLKLDNALVMIQRRYNSDLELFQAVYDALNQDLTAAIGVFSAAAASSDPMEYFRNWLGWP